MPKRPQPHSHEARQARAALREYMARAELSGNVLSKRCGVSQSTVSRFLDGTTKTVTPAVRRALVYAEIELSDCIDARPSAVDNPRVRDALGGWPGAPESVEVLVSLLRALAPIVQAIQTRGAGSAS